MGFGGISIWQLLIILAIVVLIFGTKKLKNMGSDVGGAMKNFKQAMNSDESDDAHDNEGSHKRVGKTGDADEDSPDHEADDKSNSQH